MNINPNMNMNPNMGMGMNNFFWNPMMNPAFQYMPPPFPNFQNMNQNMNQNQNMNMNQNQNMDQNQQKSGGENWTLIFERKYDNNKINVQINSEETVSTAFSKYRIKSLEANVPLKFTLQGKPLDGQLSLNASGLRDNSIITVEKITSDPGRPGCWSLVFERKDENQFISIQIESSKTVKDAATQGMASVMSIRRDAEEYFQDMKENAEDIVVDAHEENRKEIYVEAKE